MLSNLIGIQTAKSIFDIKINEFIKLFGCRFVDVN